jgi:glutathione peroxidase
MDGTVGLRRAGGGHVLKLALALFCVLLFSVANPALARGCPPLLDHTFPDLITGKPVALCQFQGRVVLVVNTASKCSYTPQYEQLEAVSRKFAPKGLAVVGFPSNDFGQQERGSSKEIAEFCKLNYGVSFPMFERSEVKGRNANALHAQLTRRTGVAPGWNFHKYLIDRNGVKVVSFESEVAPDDPRILREIERMLAEPAR